jgi:hypothetical protein
MKLTHDEKTKIFWSLIKSYEEFDRGRKQAEGFFKDERLKEVIDVINQQEDEAYALLKRFADDLKIDLPAQKKHN